MTPLNAISGRAGCWLLPAALVLTTALGAHAQNVGIGTPTPHAKAALEVKSTNKGLLPPRMTQPERNAIAPGADAAGLTVYNTTTNKLNIWNGTSWTEALLNEPVRTVVTSTFTTPGTYSYVVPAGTARLIVDARGAGGGSSQSSGYAAPGGPGGRLKASIAVTPGETLTINVGGTGVSTVGGFNGGGNGGNGGSILGGGGGGASDMRRGSALTDRLLTAGGGGGGGGGAGSGGNGGAGGYPTGGSGSSSTYSVAGGGANGGTQTGPGPATNSNANYSPGSLGTGGASQSYYSGGGGGGYYGGNGGGVSFTFQNNTFFGDGGGGGGSSWLTSTNATLLLTEAATGGGNGSITLTPVPDYAAPALDASNFINVAGDNLGNHTATTNVGLSGNWLSNAPGNANGLRIDNSGDVTLSGRLGLGTSGTPTEKLQIVNGNLQLTATSPVGVGISNASSSLNLALANGAGQYSDVAQTGDAVLRSNGRRLILAGREGGEVLVTTGAAGAEVERLRITTAGLVRVSSLAGGGTQVVTTDNSGNLSAAPVSSLADNLGNHTATTNLGLNGNWLSNAPGSANGLRVDNAGNVGVGTATPASTLDVRTPDNSAAITVGNFNAQAGALYLGNSGHGLKRAYSGANDVGLYTTAGNLYLSAAGSSATDQFALSSGGSVGIGGAAPASAALAVTSTTKGFLPPRMTLTERDAIGVPAAGLTVYNTTTNQLNTWNGTQWEASLPVTQGLPMGPALATFGYTGAAQTFTVPAGVTSVVVTATGAVGGTFVSGSNVYQGGKGAQAQTVLTVTPGETLTVYVGGTGGFHTGNGAGPGGWNGGGNARGGGGGGGGATDLRRGGTALANRLVVAAGGGGSAYLTGIGGGDGGAPNGAPGLGNTGGGGATQQNGGQQAGYNSPQVAGSLGLGGDSDFYGGGAGGGGLYGGAGSRGNGGGGGSSWVTPTGTADTRLLAGVNAGNGSLSFSLPQTYPAPTLDGTNISGTWDVSGTDYYYNSGNVGIGTSSPAQKLDVAGTARVQGTLQVGTSTVPGAIEVVGASGATTTLDQQQLFATGGAAFTDKWQSFTAGITGTLTQLDFHGGPTPGYGPASGQLSFYAGEGTTGTQLNTQAITYQQIGYNFQQFVLTTPLPVTAGQQYTFRLTAPAGASVDADGSGNNRYPGGRVDNDPFSDLAFKTYVSTPNAARLLTVLPTGQMGLGTAAPSEKLDVVGGNLKISTTGSGLIFPDGTTQTTAAVSATSATFIQNQTTTQAGASFNVGGNGTVGGNAYVNGALGVVLNGQDRPLITRGYDAFTSGNYTGAGRWGLFMEPSTLTFGVPALAGKNFQWATYSATSAIGASLMTLTQAGQLGLGTSAGTGPVTTLDVRTTDNSAAITVGSTGGGVGALYLGNANHGVKRNYATGNDVGLYTTSGTVYLSANGTSTSQFALLNNGNVGIGTAIPGQKLEVNGTALINSGYDLLLRDSQYGLGWYGTGKLWNGTTPDGPVLYGYTGGVLGTKDGGARTVLAWNKDGRVGIGTTGSSHPLTVQADGTGAVLGFNTNGGTDKYNWSLTNGGLNLSESNVASARLFVKDGGNVGIGTSNPIAPLHVKGAAGTLTQGGGGYTFFNPGTGVGTAPLPANQSKQVAAYFEGGEVWINNFVVAGALQTTSDRRIKNIVGLSDRSADLALLNKIRITDYTYIDEVNHVAGQVVKKVIAQEVEEVLPAAVTRSHQALPNVYEKATKISFANGYLTVSTAKPHALPATGGRMRLYTPTNEELNPEVTVVDAHTIRFASTEAHAAGLFVYGKYVDDFRSVDYDALSMLNVSATQELARKVAALEARGAATQAELRTVKAAAEAATQTFEARLRALEAGVGQARK